ncbi:hypothetical protein [Thalassomonas actiniarum]|uniref:Flagellar FliJ protein n=1 Tax=Thalassomonas actiniarum TaxID=485447 RepID=A0AAE9YRG5_9GAMM|nr:hypothetical protein [Thalassomonas actiniarum]WDD99342.1 hypothetical protein SG35_001225 [Thalassomonas actiniarum]
MLNKFKNLQQQKLEQLSKQRSELNDKLIGQEQYLEQLVQYQQALTDVSSHNHALALQNQHGMQQQIAKVVDFQEQQVSLTQVDLQRQNQLLKQQYCHYKGLEIISNKQAKLAQQKKQQQEDFANDDIATLAFIRTNSPQEK